MRQLTLSHVHSDPETEDPARLETSETVLLSSGGVLDKQSPGDGRDLERFREYLNLLARVEGLEAFRDRVAIVKRSLAMYPSVADFEKTWKEAIASIRNGRECPMYSKLGRPRSRLHALGVRSPPLGRSSRTRCRPEAENHRRHGPGPGPSPRREVLHGGSEDRRERREL